MTIEILYHDACPHHRSTLELVRECVRRLGLTTAIRENEGDHPSPTVLIDGKDVMGDLPHVGRVCRLDVPTEERLMQALRRAAASHL